MSTTFPFRPTSQEIGEALAAALLAGCAVLLKHYNEQQREARELDPITKAAAMLGISRDASETEIRTAFRQRMKQRDSIESHPDHGGRGDLALQLINAKNTLLAYARSDEETTA